MVKLVKDQPYLIPWSNGLETYSIKQMHFCKVYVENVFFLPT